MYHVERVKIEIDGFAVVDERMKDHIVVLFPIHFNNYDMSRVERAKGFAKEYMEELIERHEYLLSVMAANKACSGLVESSASQGDSTPEKLSARQALSQPATSR